MRRRGSLRARRGVPLLAGAALAAVVSLATARVVFADLLPTPLPTVAVPSPSLALPLATPTLAVPTLPLATPTLSPSLLAVPTLSPLLSSPTPSPSPSGCTVTLANTCVLGTTGSSPPPGGTTLPSLVPAPTPSLCVGSVACVNPSCITAGTPGCAVTTPGASPGSSPPAGTSGTSSTGTGGTSGGTGGSGGTGSGQSGGAGTFSDFGSGTGVAAPAAAQAAAAVNLSAVPVVQQLGVLPGLTFGHVAVLIPLFIVLDILAVIGLVAVVRRYRAAPAGD